MVRRTRVVLPRRQLLLSAGALAGATLVARAARAGELKSAALAQPVKPLNLHRYFVRFDVNGATIKTGSPTVKLGRERLNPGEWIECARVSYGLKRDIGTGARVSGHTHYDRIEFDRAGGPGFPALTKALELDAHKHYTHIGFDCPQGPATPMLLQALERGHTVNCTIRFFHNRRDGQEEKYMEIVSTDGRLAGVKLGDPARLDPERGEIIEGESRQLIHYAFHELQLDHVGEDGSTSAHFDWSGANQG
ncbi:MAG: hypothetical protein H6713_40910 [Myxococcales bacterium]|nr:hypothetical protein [Myxococcales bacterium]